MKKLKNYRKMVEAYIGRKLKKREIVHHINFDRFDNSLENFFVFDNNRDHCDFHRLVGRGCINPLLLKSNLDQLRAKGKPKKLSVGDRNFLGRGKRFSLVDTKKQLFITKWKQLVIKDIYPWEIVDH